MAGTTATTKSTTTSSASKSHLLAQHNQILSYCAAITYKFIIRRISKSSQMQHNILSKFVYHYFQTNSNKSNKIMTSLTVTLTYYLYIIWITSIKKKLLGGNCCDDPGQIPSVFLKISRVPIPRLAEAYWSKCNQLR